MNDKIRVSKNGRITIPKDLRIKHGWVEGTELEWVAVGEQVEVRPLVTFLESLGRDTPNLERERDCGRNIEL